MFNLQVSTIDSFKLLTKIFPLQQHTWWQEGQNATWSKKNIKWITTKVTKRMNEMIFQLVKWRGGTTKNYFTRGQVII